MNESGYSPKKLTIFLNKAGLLFARLRGASRGVFAAGVVGFGLRSRRRRV